MNFHYGPGPSSDGRPAHAAPDNNELGLLPGLTPEEVEFSRNLLGAIEVLPRCYKCPEVFLAAMVANRTGVNLLTKAALLEAVSETTDRPFTQDVDLGPVGPDDLPTPSRGALTMANHLVDAGTIYSKPDGSVIGMQACGGIGILRFHINPSSIAITPSTRIGFLRLMGGLSRVANALGVTEFECTPRHDVLVPFRSEEDIPQIIAAAHAELGRHRIIEDKIDICKVLGRTWEIRHFMLTENSGAEMVGRYVKVGSGEMVANLAQGGGGVDAEIFSTSLHRSFYPGASAEKIRGLSIRFLEAAQAQAEAATMAISRHLHSGISEVFPGLPERLLLSRSVAIDITATLNRNTGELEPVVVEPNISYEAQGLKSCDMRSFIRLLNRLDQIETRGVNDLRKLFDHSLEV